MSSSPGAGYKLRPNKAVDRELFLSLLVRLAVPLGIDGYQYIGLGGPFLEDFRIVHTRLGINDMICVDEDEETHKRQLFNRPVESINCVHSNLEQYLDSSEFEKPVILWLDFTDPRGIQAQIETFSQQIEVLPTKSILRITLNSNASSLGDPNKKEVAVKVDGQGDSPLPTLQEWRLARFKKRFPDHYPATIKTEDMTQKNYGSLLLQVLKLAGERAALNVPGRKLVWCFSSQYKDGQTMVTTTLMLLDAQKNGIDLEELVSKWEYHCSSTDPHVLDLPALSTLERLTMESSDDPKSKLDYQLPKSELDTDPIITFKKYYRVYPHFSRVEI